MTVHGTVGAHAVPASLRTLGTLPAVDYADDFVFATDVAATPERWARAMFGDVPSPGERFIWRGLLGLRLARGRSPETVAGWRVTGRGPDWIRLEAASRSLTANLVVRAGGGQVALGTLMHYRRPLGRLVWTPLSAVHRRLAPGVFGPAAATIRADG
ncbi:DUF2867 domain-containing protein [Actinomadura flavalba]|uniref:DUF2867 domain-containing protein n=1 Tax=Actinomadura flavalba TaxID=1120938 RepID=UPI00037FBE8A|nr:DUF2867 domain-containing protein [Actinomadura flavalba]